MLEGFRGLKPRVRLNCYNLKEYEDPLHEMSIAQGVIEIVQDEMTKNNATVLRSVRLNIGALSAIVPESLSFCFEVAVTGTDLEGARLIMDVVPLMGYCHKCEKEFEIDDYAFSCPACKSSKIDTISGQDLAIIEIEVDS